MKTFPILRISMAMAAMITIQSLSAQNLNANNKIASQFSNNPAGKVVPSFTESDLIMKKFKNILAEYLMRYTT